tara:strand:+ start:1277 stop:1465 length:189 start_codon:yes stop_codon:yes gene_type:complete
MTPLKKLKLFLEFLDYFDKKTFAMINKLSFKEQKKILSIIKSKKINLNKLSFLDLKKLVNNS